MLYIRKLSFWSNISIKQKFNILFFIILSTNLYSNPSAHKVLSSQDVLNAASSCNTQILILAKAQGFNLKNITSSKGESLLQIAFEGINLAWLNYNDFKECIAFLLQNEFNPQVKTSDPNPLSQSGLLIDEARIGHDDLVSILKNYGAH